MDLQSTRTPGSWAQVVFALPFLVAGGFFALAGFGVVPLPGKANAPHWVIGFVGLAFFAAGAAMASFGLRGMLRRRRRTDPRFDEEPALRDHPWDPAGTADDSVGRAVAAWWRATFLAVFLAPFHWWAFGSGDGPLPVKIGIGFLDLFLLAALGSALLRSWRVLRHGVTRLRFESFPFHPGRPLRVTFAPNRFAELRATLRCVEERYETKRVGGKVHGSLRTEVLWSEERVLTPHRLDVEVEIAFTLPADPSLATRLSEAPVRYWELTLAAKEPGVDFDATFLLPVYPARGEVAGPTPAEAPKRPAPRPSLTA